MPDTQPITATRTYVDAIYDAADQSGVRTDEIKAQLQDPSVVQTKESQRYTASRGALKLVEEGAKHLAKEVPVLGFAVGATSPLFMLARLGGAWLEAHDQGDALANAHARDAMHLAMLNLGSAVLPEGFVHLNAHLLRESAQGASRILTQLISSGKHSEVSAAIEQFVQRGSEQARAKGVVDAASLACARQDPAFEADYRNNPAFALGVQAAIYVHANAGNKAP